MIDSIVVVVPEALREEQLKKAIPSLTHVIIFSAENADANFSGVVPGDSVEWFKQHWG